MSDINVETDNVDGFTKIKAGSKVGMEAMTGSDPVDLNPFNSLPGHEILHKTISTRLSESFIPLLRSMCSVGFGKKLVDNLILSLFEFFIMKRRAQPDAPATLIYDDCCHFELWDQDGTPYIKVVPVGVFAESLVRQLSQEAKSRNEKGEEKNGTGTPGGEDTPKEGTID